MTSGESPDRDRPAAFDPLPESVRLRAALLGVLVVVIVVCLVLLGRFYLTRTDASAGGPGTRIGDLLGGDDEQQQRRDAVMSQAQQFMLRLNTYGPDLLDDQGQMPDYRSSVTALLTPKFKVSFEQGVVAAEQTVAQVGVERKAEVFSTGVSSMDVDSARVLVAGSFTNSFPDPKAPDDAAKRIADEPAPFRVEVSLVQTQGEWRVDDFSPVTVPGEDPSQQPGALPSDQPSDLPSDQPSAPSSPSPTGRTGSPTPSGKGSR